MKLFDLEEKFQNGSHIYMAFFMEGDLPASLDNISLQDTVNNCLIARPYLHNLYGTGGRCIMQPMDRIASSKNWPLHSAWQEVDTIYGKQVLPKTRMRRLRDLTVAANRLRPFEQVTNIIGCLLTPRFAQPQSAANILAHGSGTFTVDLDTTNNSSYPFTYDFGADVEVTGFMKISSSSNAANNPLSTSYIQAQINGEWKDVTAQFNTNTSNADETIYPFSTDKVVARYFRVRHVAVGQTQLFGGGIRFMGKYVAGTPRTFGKIGHVLMMPFAAGSDLTGAEYYNMGLCNIQNSNQSNVLDDRIIAWNGYTVTDDPKQINNFDLFLPNGLAFEQGTDLYPPFFTVPTPVTELGAA